ncbi:ammonium transporter [Candidatus Sumerlaeota bacterium]|nr:ammonium transporter [Candidatus Sumerlaeota bacterium]
MKIIISILIFFGSVQAGFAADGAPAIDSGNTAWMLVSSALVLLMMPGLAMFYGGLVHSRNVLGTMMHSYGAMAVIGVLWVVCGYAMAFGGNVLGGWFGWQSDLFLLRGLDDMVDGGLPMYAFAMFQGMFAIITPAILAGSFAERIKFPGFCLFIALWCLLVYCPLCHWVWATDGFLFKDGAIDFAGGTVVHISSGISGLVMALLLGARHGHPNIKLSPNSMVLTMIGAGLLWVGWFGFNAGSAVAANLNAAQALASTHTAAAAGALTWVLIEFFRYGKATGLGLASGILTGLVVITPAAGTVPPGGAMVLAALACIVCTVGLQLKNKLRYDDTLDAFGIHGLAGITGAICLTFFLRGGVLEGNDHTLMQQLLVQIKSAGITIVYAGGLTLVIGILVEKTIGLRMSAEDETRGMDQTQHGEHGYEIVSMEY